MVAKPYNGPEEDIARQRLVQRISDIFVHLLLLAHDAAFEIGGTFRGPGIKWEIKKALKRKLEEW